MPLKPLMLRMLACAVALAVIVFAASGQVPDKLDFDTSTTAPVVGVVRVSVRPGGKLELSIDPSEPSTRAATQPTTQSLRLPQLNGAEISPSALGHRVVFDFSKISEHGLITKKSDVVDGTLIVRTVEKEKSSLLLFPRRLVPPFEMTIKFDRWRDQRINLFVTSEAKTISLRPG
jgi:hypothetical protein